MGRIYELWDVYCTMDTLWIFFKIVCMVIAWLVGGAATARLIAALRGHRAERDPDGQ